MQARAAARSALVLLALLTVWELVGRTTALGASVLPPPSRILAQAVADRELYWLHGVSTVRSSVCGFGIGAGAAILAALAFCVVPALEVAFRGVNIAIFAMPAIVAGPLLVLFFHGNWPQILLAALMVYFPTMSMTLLGLRAVDPRLADLVAAYGGGAATLMRLVRLRGALPGVLAGLRVAAPLAVLGAVLGEFGSGARWGFGTFLLAVLPQGNPVRLWGIGLATSMIALAGYALFLLPARRAGVATASVTMAVRAMTPAPGHGVARAGAVLVAILVPFLLWWGLLALTGLSPIIAPGPVATVQFMFGQGAGPLGQALAQTLPLAGGGLLAGLAVAFLLASLTILAPVLARAMLPVAMVAQNMPVVALVPFILIFFGRGLVASLFVAVLVVFFPAYVMLNQGFSSVPRAASDLVVAYGGGRITQLWRIAVPYAIGHLFAAARLVAPQALLGIMVAEWLVTGTGLGNLLNVSRAMLDYDTIWAGALASILVAVLVYELVGLLERKFRY